VVTAISSDTLIPKYTCEKKQDRFTIGQDVLPGWGKNIMFLNFSDTTIILWDSVGTYDTIGFTFVQSLFSCKGHEIWLTIDSIEYAFLFNTDASKEFLSLPQYAKHRKCSFVDNNFRCDHFYVQYEKHKKENDTDIASHSELNYSIILSDIMTTKYKKENYSKFFIDTLIIQQTNTITMGDLDSISGKVIYAKNITRPTMGMKFISQFDWIIDRYNGKVYAKKIKE
jgi:hypothetical protein